LSHKKLVRFANNALAVTPLAAVLTHKLKIVAYKTKGRGVLSVGGRIPTMAKKSLLSSRTLSGSKTAYLNAEKEAYLPCYKHAVYLAFAVSLRKTTNNVGFLEFFS
jgi:hypothetical protein